MNFLLEVGTEELPAGEVLGAATFLREKVEELLRERGIAFEEVREFATPRRLVVFVKGLAEREPQKKELVWGPPKAVAFDAEGRPTKALEGFLKKQGASPEEVKVLTKGKGEYVAVEKVVGGRPSEEILAEAVPEILDAIPFKKRMRWGAGKTFLRPVRWILALADDRVVPIKWGNLEADRLTYGHRFVGGGSFRGRELEVPDAVEYFKLLRENFVEVDHRERKRRIEEALDLHGARFGARVPQREGLVEENTFLAEFVHPVLGSFDEKYLELPPLVIITVAAHHQRFFCFQKPDGSLVPKFLAVAGTPPKDEGVVREGFEKVLKARLEDALFFYREDLKRPLESLVPELRGILQHPKLGTLYDKTMRLVELSAELARELAPQKVKKAERAAYLSKADLLTEMVKELDELQGYMGFVYAKAQGEDEEVARALWEQYKPKGADDELPATETGTVLALADKIHDLVGYFGVGEKPRSTADPLGLRRAALGVIRLIEGKNLRLDLERFVELAYDLFEELELPKEDLLRELDEFFKQRLVAYLSSRYPKELVLAVVEPRSGFEVADAIRTVSALAALVETLEFELAREAYRRVRKIIAKVKETFEVKPEKFVQKEERELFEKLLELEGRFQTATVEEKLRELARYKETVDRFFDSVMVMAEDEALRQNRIALLQRVRRLFESVADFEKVSK
ncbi:MAG: glycine--tRNA ligase subunit beta [Aquificae bacterium]|nr:glycine--tRNA ligase subunit beta [Aquificota bacterium]